jgi:hypothetical protein
MAASKYDFAIEQGTSFKLSLIYKDANGTPVDLTGWCARLVWKTNKFIIDDPNGKLTLMLPASTTNGFNFNTAKYDLELQSPDDIYSGGGKYTTRLLFGTINIVKRFSQAASSLECST